MSVAVKTNDLERFQTIIDDQKSMAQELEELREKNAELQEQISTQAEDNKELEQFRSLLQPIPMQFYKIQLHDSSLMRKFLGQMKSVYGPRFGKSIENMNEKDAADTKFARQCLDSAALACIRYCVSQNSRWNDMVAHYLS